MTLNKIISCQIRSRQTIFLFSDATTTDTIALLNNCSASVEDGCTVPTVDTATLDSCVTSFTAVETKNAECYALLTAANPVCFNVDIS